MIVIRFNCSRFEPLAKRSKSKPTFLTDGRTQSCCRSKIDEDDNDDAITTTLKMQLRAKWIIKGWCSTQRNG
jgi:hypothetical protein